jgi:hypothetical protein
VRRFAWSAGPGADLLHRARPTDDPRVWRTLCARLVAWYGDPFLSGDRSLPRCRGCRP